MSYSNNGASRGDLGFIPNHRYYGPNRLFFGAPGNPSKKGVAAQVPRLVTEPNAPVAAAAAEPQTAEPTSGSMMQKRTEWLEKQERKITATVNEHTSEQQRIAHTLQECREEQARMEAAHKQSLRRAQRMYNEQHWVYGYTERSLRGMTGAASESALLSYRNSVTKGEAPCTIELAPENTWVLLCYPMEVVASESLEQCLMKVKTVAPRTGQIKVTWGVVFEKDLVNNTQRRFIREFSLAPHA